MLKTQVTKSKLGALAPSQLWRYRQELAERARLGYPTCFTNLWALINEALLHDKVGRGVGPSLGDMWERLPASGSCGLTLGSFPQPHEHKLSDQREALSRGQNPLPIYCALNSKEKGLSTFEFGGDSNGNIC